MKIADVEWSAQRAKAKLKEGRLTIRASSTDTSDGKVERQELHLQIVDYTGPGDYTTGLSGSRFLQVGIDTDAIAAGDDSDEAATKAASSALSGAKHMMLSSAKVTITAASESEISGSFSWQPPKGSKDPALTEGSFRAVLD